jgi:hypothetical protein
MEKLSIYHRQCPCNIALGQFSMNFYACSSLIRIVKAINVKTEEENKNVSPMQIKRKNLAQLTLGLRSGREEKSVRTNIEENVLK